MEKSNGGEALGDELVSHAQQGGATCSLEVGVVPEGAQAIVDTEAVRRGMLNLLDNALRYAEGSELTVRLTVEGRAARGEVVCAVADRGPGIPAARREAVLQPFERLSSEGEGVGLGLPIVRAIAEAHGGRLVVRGRSEGSGAVLEMRLPWVTEKAGGATARPMQGAAG